MNIVCCVYWWNPILKLFKNHVDELIETYVDDFVTSELDCNEKYNYMKCIFDIYRSEDNLSKDSAPTESIIGIGRKNNLLKNQCFNMYFIIACYVFLCFLLGKIRSTKFRRSA